MKKWVLDQERKEVEYCKNDELQTRYFIMSIVISAISDTGKIFRRTNRLYSEADL